MTRNTVSWLSVAVNYLLYTLYIYTLYIYIYIITGKEMKLDLGTHLESHAKHVCNLQPNHILSIYDSNETDKR